MWTSHWGGSGQVSQLGGASGCLSVRWMEMRLGTCAGAAGWEGPWVLSSLESFLPPTCCASLTPESYNSAPPRVSLGLSSCHPSAEAQSKRL